MPRAARQYSRLSVSPIRRFVIPPVVDWVAGGTLYVIRVQRCDGQGRDVVRADAIIDCVDCFLATESLPADAPRLTVSRTYHSVRVYACDGVDAMLVRVSGRIRCHGPERLVRRMIRVWPTGVRSNGVEE